MDYRSAIRDLPLVLRRLRQRAGHKTQRAALRQIRRRTGVSITPTRISEWERGRSMPAFPSIIAFLTGLGCDFADLQRELELVVGETEARRTYARAPWRPAGFFFLNFFVSSREALSSTAGRLDPHRGAGKKRGRPVCQPTAPRLLNRSESRYSVGSSGVPLGSPAFSASTVIPSAISSSSCASWRSIFWIRSGLNGVRVGGRRVHRCRPGEPAASGASAIAARVSRISCMNSWTMKAMRSRDIRLSPFPGWRRLAQPVW